MCNRRPALHVLPLCFHIHAHHGLSRRLWQPAGPFRGKGVVSWLLTQKHQGGGQEHTYKSLQAYLQSPHATSLPSCRTRFDVQVEMVRALVKQVSWMNGFPCPPPPCPRYLHHPTPMCQYRPKRTFSLWYLGLYGHGLQTLSPCKVRRACPFLHGKLSWGRMSLCDCNMSVRAQLSLENSSQTTSARGLLKQRILVVINL
jgi:hypothetical protein